MKRYKSADEYIAGASQWQDELKQLRKILAATPLKEEVKWGAPCYTYKGKNVVGLSGFKSYFGLWFHQGALLEDREKPVVIPPELKQALAENSIAEQAFRNLSPGLQREYAEYISGAKRVDTKMHRLEKILPLITGGGGLNDKYR